MSFKAGDIVRLHYYGKTDLVKIIDVSKDNMYEIAYKNHKREIVPGEFLHSAVNIRARSAAAFSAAADLARIFTAECKNSPGTISRL